MASAPRQQDRWSTPRGGEKEPESASRGHDTCDLRRGALHPQGQTATTGDRALGQRYPPGARQRPAPWRLSKGREKSIEGAVEN